MPVLASTSTGTNLASFASHNWKQGEPLPLPGSVTACSPPPVHACTLRSSVHTQSRVRFAPHAPAALAQRSHADSAVSPSEAIFLLEPAYLSISWRYCCAATL